MVLLRNSARDCRKGDKLSSRWLGPYMIKESLGNDLYRLLNPTSGHILKKAVNGCRYARNYSILRAYLLEISFYCRTSSI